MNAAVIIPAFQPEHSLAMIIDRLNGRVSHIVVVNDGSTGDKKEIFNSIHEKAIVIHHEKNLGKGAAIKSGIRYIHENIADCDVIGVMDADGQHLPEDMESLLNKAVCNVHALIIGVRKIGSGMPFKSRIGNKVTRTVFLMLSGTYVSDTQTGLRAFSRSLSGRFLKVKGSRYEYETNVLFTCAREKIEIMEVPIKTVYLDASNSCSHFDAIKDSARIYKDILKFSMSSLSSFAIDYISFCLLTICVGSQAAGLLLANIAARLISGTYNYFINSRFVFRSAKTFQTGLKYLLLAALILGLNSVFLEFYTSLCAISTFPAKLLTEISLFTISFTVQKKKIFIAHHKGGT